MRGHPLPYRHEERWIEINQKKNKPAERLYEIKRICIECGVATNTAYLTPKQLAEYDKTGRKAS